MRKRNHWIEKAKIDKHVPIPKIQWSKTAGRDIAREMQEGDSIFLQNTKRGAVCPEADRAQQTFCLPCLTTERGGGFSRMEGSPCRK